MRVASIDIGTNTTLLLVAEQGPDGNVTVLAERAEITRLGRGIGGDGLLKDDNVNRTLEVLASYAELARSLGAPIVAIGTEGLRRAPNAGVFLEKANTILGTAVEVISGDREAQLTFLAAQRSFPAEAAGSVVVIDIGGGSTEIIAAQDGRIGFRQSLPLGSVRLTEAFVRSDPPTQAEVDELEAHVVNLLKDVPFAANATLIGAAGTVTTVAAMAQDLRDYDPAKVHGYHLTVAQVEAQMQRLRTSTQAERESMAGLDPRRADVIFAGSTLLKKITERVGSPHVLVSDRGIRWGRLFDELDRASPTKMGVIKTATIALSLLVATVVCQGCKPKVPQIVAPMQEDFERAELGPTWLDTGGGYGITEGTVQAKGAYNHPLWLRKRLPKDAIIEFDATAMTSIGDIKVELYGDGESFDPDKGGYMATGYVLVFGGWRNSLSVISRENEHDEGRKAQRPDMRVEPNRKYHFTVTRKNGTIDWKIDGQPFLAWTDPTPFEGTSHEYFGFNNWEADVRFDNLSIRPAP